MELQKGARGGTQCQGSRGPHGVIPVGSPAASWGAQPPWPLTIVQAWLSSFIGTSMLSKMPSVNPFLLKFVRIGRF